MMREVAFEEGLTERTPDKNEDDLKETAASRPSAEPRSDIPVDGYPCSTWLYSLNGVLIRRIAANAV
ncbi:MAG: hypothetical protein BRD46_00575 [Bacteroidetes bacterium QS_8_68_15]|nr:MAG: hypothetical protein BRD46_00575 [Bacteroidetes bacterium QS_8_68_15]